MPPIGILILTFVALTVGTPFLIGIVMLLVPGGRKGKMRTEREVAHAGMSVEQAKALYASRLAYDGFTIVNATNPARLEAVKQKAPSTETHTHSDKELGVEIDFMPDAVGGVRVRIAAWMNDFILYDTGEGRLIDLTLDRLLNAQLDSVPPPIVPNRSFMALSSLVSVLIALAIIVLVAATVQPGSARWAAAVVGAALACPANMLMAFQALTEIRRRPAELTGSGIVAATLVLGVLAMLGGVAVLFARFGQTLARQFT